MNHAISRRLFTAAALLLASTGAVAAPAPKLSDDDKALVDKAVAYLQGLTRATGRFVQTDNQGKRAPGTLYLQRPGKIRFEYDPPNDNVLVVSDGNQVSVSDAKLGAPTVSPLRLTPLALFLSKEIRLDKGVVVTNVDHDAGHFTITARDGGHDTAGQIVLVFTNDPVALSEWTVIDGQKGRTRVQITSLKPAASLDPDLFRFKIPHPTGRTP